MEQENVIKQMESLIHNSKSFITTDGDNEIWEKDIEALNKAIETVQDYENLKKEAVYFMKQHEEAMKVIKRLRTSLNDETEQKLELLTKVDKLRRQIENLVIALDPLLELARNHILMADGYPVVQKAKKALENVSY